MSRNVPGSGTSSAASVWSTVCGSTLACTDACRLDSISRMSAPATDAEPVTRRTPRATRAKGLTFRMAWLLVSVRELRPSSRSLPYLRLSRRFGCAAQRNGGAPRCGGGQGRLNSGCYVQYRSPGGLLGHLLAASSTAACHQGGGSPERDAGGPSAFWGIGSLLALLAGAASVRDGVQRARRAASRDEIDAEPLRQQATEGVQDLLVVDDEEVVALTGANCDDQVVCHRGVYVEHPARAASRRFSATTRRFAPTTRRFGRTL